LSVALTLSLDVEHIERSISRASNSDGSRCVSCVCLMRVCIFECCRISIQECLVRVSGVHLHLCIHVCGVCGCVGVCLSICTSVYLSVCLSACLSVWLAVCLCMLVFIRTCACVRMVCVRTCVDWMHELEKYVCVFVLLECFRSCMP